MGIDLRHGGRLITIKRRKRRSLSTRAAASILALVDDTPPDP